MPIERSAVKARIENAAGSLGMLWPLSGFNSSNPLTGLEDRPFDEAVRRAETLFGGRGYPSAWMFAQAWDQGDIDTPILEEVLREAGVQGAPADVLTRLEAAEPSGPADASSDAGSGAVDRALTKWLAAFLDQGQAAWAMPNREDGFYAAWRAQAPYDADVPGVTRADDLPDTLLGAFQVILEGRPESTWEALFEYHLAALPGWTSFIKRRAQAKHDPWADAHPISIADYLAVRLLTLQAMGQSLDPPAASEEVTASSERHRLASLWLTAWEETYRQTLLRKLHDAGTSALPTPATTEDDDARPTAQLVFCIDVRSERIRRHLEGLGAYETYGFAGFFGIPMLHAPYDGAEGKACPPILDPKHRIADRPASDRTDAAEAYDEWRTGRKFGQKWIKTLKDNVSAAFGFVEASGGFFGAAMALRTLSPSSLFRMEDRRQKRVPGPNQFCEPDLDGTSDAAQRGRLPGGLSARGRALYAETALRLMGWSDTFAPLVVFTGHGSQTPNNPYKSSLDCGACAGRPGGPNARVLATLCNDPAVRATLRERGIDIPDDTVFIAGEHNTTTDGVTLFSKADDLGSDAAANAYRRLAKDLSEAQHGSASERVATMAADGTGPAVAETERRAGDWAETRPEWGLAGNAAFIVGPRDWTASLDLEGRCFLHSYDWRADDDGTALETILSGPLVVGEWISTQYYFSTVDNAVYGSGSKVTHNVVGGMAIQQGNGGDLMTGLPLQSLQRSDTELFHAPIRLLGVIQAPIDRIRAILDRQAPLARLFDHEWLALAVLDPETQTLLRYRPGGSWVEADVTDLADAALA